MSPIASLPFPLAPAMAAPVAAPAEAGVAFAVLLGKDGAAAERQDGSASGKDVPDTATVDPALAWLAALGILPPPVAPPAAAATTGAPPITGAAAIVVPVGPVSVAPMPDVSVSAPPVPLAPAAVALPLPGAPAGGEAIASGPLATALPVAPADASATTTAPAPRAATTPTDRTAPVPLPAAAAPPPPVAAAPPAVDIAARTFADARHRAVADPASPEPQPAAAATAAPMIPLAAAAGGAQHAPLDMAQHRWPEAMIARIEMLRDMADANDMSIRLAPDALGTIDVSLKRDGDAVQVQLTAEHAQTRQLLAEAQPKLAELAAERGVKLQHAGTDAGGGERRAPAPPPAADLPAAPPSATRATDAAPTDRIA